MKKIIVSCAIVLQLVPFSVLGQDFCEGNFDYDKDVDGSDASTFKQDFGRSSLQNPCPPDGPAPVERSFGLAGSSPAIMMPPPSSYERLKRMRLLWMLLLGLKP